MTVKNVAYVVNEAGAVQMVNKVDIKTLLTNNPKFKKATKAQIQAAKANQTHRKRAAEVWQPDLGDSDKDETEETE